MTHTSPWEPIQYLAYIRDKCFESRYKIYAIVAPYKMLLFFSFSAIITGNNFNELFDGFGGEFANHTIVIQEVRASLNERLPDFEDITNDLYRNEIRGNSSAVWWILFIHAMSSYLCYVFGKFACKVHMQTFSFTLPINLAVPVTVSVLIILCGLRHSNVCSFHETLPDYTFFKTPPSDFLFSYIFKQFVWIWIFWLFAQTWITRHLWKPKGFRNASTEKLFMLPMYDSLIVDQSMAMNRRREEYEELLMTQV